MNYEYYDNLDISGYNYIMAESTIHVIPKLPNIKEDNGRSSETFNSKLISKYIAQQVHNYRKGDIITYLPEEERDRNSGFYIYNGIGVDKLESKSDIDIYGYIPDKYDAIREFNLHYWENVITHNHFIRINLASYSIQILDQLRFKPIYIDPENPTYVRIKLHINITVKTIYEYDYFNLYIILRSRGNVLKKKENDIRSALIEKYNTYMAKQLAKNICCNVVAHSFEEYEDYSNGLEADECNLNDHAILLLG